MRIIEVLRTEVAAWTSGIRNDLVGVAREQAGVWFRTWTANVRNIHGNWFGRLDGRSDCNGSGIGGGRGAIVTNVIVLFVDPACADNGIVGWVGGADTLVGANVAGGALLRKDAVAGAAKHGIGKA